MSRRPRTLLGLAVAVAQLRPRVALAVGVLGAALFTAPMWWLAQGATETPTPSDEIWTFGEWRYDYLEVFALGPDGAGAYVLGYDQALRQDTELRYRVEGDELLLYDLVDLIDGERVPSDTTVRTRFVLERGEFVFESENPYGGPERYVYGCALHLDTFLHGEPRTLYACPEPAP